MATVKFSKFAGILSAAFSQHQKGGGEELSFIQGKELQLCFVEAAVKRYPMPKVRETQVSW